jgi:signal peptidase I
MSETNEFDNENSGINNEPEDNNENQISENPQSEQEPEMNTAETVGVTYLPQSNWKREVLEWVSSIAIALVIALVLRNFVFTLVKVDGTSMVPTLQNNERLVVVRIGYKPQANDIVIFTPRNRTEPFIKRVIGMPGQTVEIDNRTGDVFVDGEKLNEPYINNKTTSPVTTVFEVPENHVFVMGDNRGNSHDSRAEDVGFVSYDSIMGKAVFRLWPFNSFGTLK